MHKVTTFFTAKEWKEVQEFLQDSDMSLYALLKNGALAITGIARHGNCEIRQKRGHRVR